MNDTEKSQVIMTVPRATKGAWVAASRNQGRKLTDWLLERLEAPDLKSAKADFYGFGLGVAAFYPFERYVLALQDADARELFQRLRDLDAQQDDAVAAIKIALSYLEKHCRIVDDTADRDLFHDINAKSLSYYNACQWLTHVDLVNVLSNACGGPKT